MSRTRLVRGARRISSILFVFTLLSTPCRRYSCDTIAIETAMSKQFKPQKRTNIGGRNTAA